jgi:hypothetical protein
MAAELGLAINVFQAFETCIKAYQFISVANNTDRDSNHFFSRLQWEHYRLLQWSKRTGLEFGKPSEKLNWQYATQLLGEQETLLSSAAKVKMRYNLDVSEEEVPLSRQKEDLKERYVSGFIESLRRLRPELYSQRTYTTKSKNGPIKRLRWASLDKVQADRIVKDISELNDRLEALLDSADREWMRDAISDMLRDIISRCNNAGDIETIQSLINPKAVSSNDALAAAATLKQIRILMRKSTSTPSEISLPELRQLSYRRLKSFSPSRCLQYRELEACKYDGVDMIVDWRTVPSATWNVVERHMQCLALILSKTDDPSFHTLPLLGLLAWQEQCRFGFVHRIPPSSKACDGIWHHKSLHAIISDYTMVSLTTRVDIAIQMGQTILQFHTAGWLHKAIRSHNIIFLTSNSDDTVASLLRDPYLVGFDYARPDSKSGQELTELPDTPLLMDLYRHPKSRGIHRQSYQKQFDLYGLGCLLLELALWKPLVEIAALSHGIEIQEILDAKDSENYDVQFPSFLNFELNEKLLMLVEHSAGYTFCEAVKICFSAESLTGGAGTNTTLGAQKQVLEHLRRCKL